MSNTIRMAATLATVGHPKMAYQVNKWFARLLLNLNKKLKPVVQFLVVELGGVGSALANGSKD